MVAAERKQAKDGGDDECFERHDRWYESVLAPKIRLIIFSLLGGCATLVVAMVMYISSNTVRDHELKESEIYVSQKLHERDIARIEDRIEKMETNINSSMQQILEKLERNHQVLQRKQ